MNNEHCIKCGVRINEKRGPNDKPSARIVCDNCCSKAPCSQCNKALDVIGVRTDGLELLCDACKSSVPLLVIEVKDLNSVPIVRHNGVAINGMVVIEYLYGTKTHEVGKHEYTIEHMINQGKDKVPLIRKLKEKIFG